MNKIKLIFVGEGAVGKTSLISQYVDKKFNEEYVMTVGRDKATKDLEINGKAIKLEIWDTPGQEKFNQVNKIFMKNTKIALIVYSITDKQSFERLNKWIEMVKDINKNENVTIGIVANKSDLFESAEVTKEEGEIFAKEKNILFFETSAKDYKSIEKAFIGICTSHLEKNPNNENPVPPDNDNDVKPLEQINEKELENITLEKDNIDDSSSKCTKCTII